jgi:hypothetical protein
MGLGNGSILKMKANKMVPVDAAIDLHKDQICAMMLHHESNFLTTASNDMTIGFHKMGQPGPESKLVENTVMRLGLEGSKLNDMKGLMPTRFYTAAVDGAIC